MNILKVEEIAEFMLDLHAGQERAEKYLSGISAHVKIGDDLHHIVSQYTTCLSDDHDAFLRGFLGALERHLEALA